MVLQVLHQNLDLGKLQSFTQTCLEDDRGPSRPHASIEADIVSLDSPSAISIAAGAEQAGQLLDEIKDSRVVEGCNGDLYSVWRYQPQHRFPSAALQNAQEFLLDVLAAHQV